MPTDAALEPSGRRPTDDGRQVHDRPQAAARRAPAKPVREEGRPLPLRTPARCSSSSACVITFTVLFPILWIFSLALDPRNLSRPDSLIPPGASLDAFARVIAQPTSDEISLLELARNSFLLASSIALLLGR